MKSFQQSLVQRNLPSWLSAPVDEDGNSLDVFISTYPMVVEHVCERIATHGKNYAELCCGIGVSLMYMAKLFENVIGFDYSPEILSHAARNLVNAKSHPDFLVNSFQLYQLDLLTETDRLIGLLADHRTDIIVYDIPWWYDHDGERFPAKNPDLKSLITCLREVTPNIVIYAPPYMDHKYFEGIVGECEVEQVFLHKPTKTDHDRNIVYLGNLTSGSKTSKITFSP